MSLSPLTRSASLPTPMPLAFGSTPLPSTIAPGIRPSLTAANASSLCATVVRSLFIYTLLTLRTTRNFSLTPTRQSRPTQRSTPSSLTAASSVCSLPMAPTVLQLVKDDSGWNLAFNSLNTLMPDRPQNAAMFDDLLVQTFETTQADTSNIVVYQQIERSGKFQPVVFITSEAIAGISDGFIRADGAYAAVGLPGNPQTRVFGVTELMQVQEVETSFFRRTFNRLKGSAPAELAIDTLQRVDPMQKTFSSEFGSRVTISRDTMAIGAPGASEGMGGVFFFQNQSSYFEPIPWKDNGQLMVWPPGESIVRFGSNILELYVDDTASGFLVAGTENNVLYVYPIENGYLPHGDTNAFSLMPAPAPSDAFYFGTDIAIHDHLFVIGSRNSLFYVATMDEKWKMTNMVTIASPSPDNIQFGYYVSIRGDGTKIATSDVSSTGSGYTFGSVFERTDNGWVYSAVLHAPKSTGRQELCSNSAVHARYQESSVLIADGYNGSTGRIRRFDPKPRSSQFTPSVIDVSLEYGQIIIDMSVSDELLLNSTANPTGLFALFPVVPDHTGMAVVLLVLFVIFTTAVVVSFLTGIFCIQLALFALTTIGCGLSVKRLQAWDIRGRKKIFAKSELAKLDIRRQDRYKFSAIVDFYIAKEEITETQVVATGGIGSHPSEMLPAAHPLDHQHSASPRD
ncbi:hypothetical protein J8273_2937 [Carpediemonas membranifera]|uniref:Uncharacterized protein n=1 Tax=Carpediemonas membranifera TaxID=201153 RepID=A0A8J6AZT0_9EUKA|nr:hypothetical protein J8273_2937 [Carpediemonas membranifera]|eukprot:KAG9395370.1 hypothetical protein J8273_2937 [Carpediemonas membranifera]